MMGSLGLAPSPRPGAGKWRGTRSPGSPAVTRRRNGRDGRASPRRGEGERVVRVLHGRTLSRPRLYRTGRDGFAPATAEQPPGSCGPSPEHSRGADSSPENPTDRDPCGSGVQPHLCPLRHTQPPGNPGSRETERERADSLRGDGSTAAAVIRRECAGRTVPARAQRGRQATRGARSLLRPPRFAARGQSRTQLSPLQSCPLPSTSSAPTQNFGRCAEKPFLYSIYFCDISQSQFLTF